VHYPTVYFLPFAFGQWQKGTGVQQTLDALISTGQMPPIIGVFIDTQSGPYVDSDCADSLDGKEQMETFISSTLPTYMDANYRTIARPAYRGLLGFSQGGFCSTMLLFRHPDTFRQAATFGGYYSAGMQSPQTVNAWRPYGGDPATMEAHSPLLLAPTIPESVRPDLFVLVSGYAAQPFYGDQFTAFGAALDQAGIPNQQLVVRNAHSWQSVRANLPVALRTLTQVQMGLTPPPPPTPAPVPTPSASASPAASPSPSPSPSPPPPTPSPVPSPSPRPTASPSRSRPPASAPRATLRPSSPRPTPSPTGSPGSVPGPAAAR
jgi:enterochelin esterase-like enzyme